MIKHLKYLRYVIIHKWFVFLECCKRGIVWQGIVHDWTKFLPIEWFPYVENFYGKEENKEANKPAYDYAWLHHQKINKHHWQWWVLRRDYGEVEALPIPDKYRKEMLSDWIGVGRAFGCKDGLADAAKWYSKARYNMVLHPDTRKWVEKELGLESLAKVRYEADTEHLDGLTHGKVYTVIGENENQFFVNNDLGSTSKIQKTKFSPV